jgi:hypothetical protein
MRGVTPFQQNVPAASPSWLSSSAPKTPNVVGLPVALPTATPSRTTVTV